jgi:ectoine hydroxylase-related dioxygenase (phytanoyl-CoA dioxygenase family)
MTVDLRTRVDMPISPVDPDTFFGETLAGAFATNAELLAPALRTLTPPDVVVDVDGRCHQLSIDGDRVRVERVAAVGQAGRMRVTDEQLTDLALDQVTPVGWYSNGTLALERYRFEDIVDWWVLIRAALDGRAPHIAGAVRLVDPDGGPLDLQRTFTIDDSLDEMRDVLERVGYLHLAGMYSDAEMAAVSADMDRAAPGYEPGDGRSWWADTVDGAERLVRMQGFDHESPATTDLLADQRIARLAAISGDGHQLQGAEEPNRIEALVKPLGVVRGLSDLPWHKDCAQGRHSYTCCGLTIGISVTGADAGSGQLRVVAGSHRALTWPAFIRPGFDLPEVDLPTRTGDVTVHLSCTLHMAQEPVTRERRVLYTGLRLPALAGTDPDAEAAATARRRAIREASPTTVSQPKDPARPWAQATA